MHFATRLKLQDLVGKSFGSRTVVRILRMDDVADRTVFLIRCQRCNQTSENTYLMLRKLDTRSVGCSLCKGSVAREDRPINAEPLNVMLSTYNAFRWPAIK